MGQESSKNSASVLGLDHVAVGVAAIETICAAVARELGGEPYQSGPGLGFRGAQWVLGGGGRIEAIEPDGPDEGFLHRFLAAGGNRIHHLTFKVRDISRAAEAAQKAGYTVVGFSDRFAGWKEMFLHPKEAQGIVVQLAESHPELDDDGWTDAWPFPRHAVSPERRPRVLGLRLSARSEAHARAQWCALLGGTPENRGQDMVVSWPQSPLQLRIRFDSTEKEGPLGLEAVGGDSGKARNIEALGCALFPVDE